MDPALSPDGSQLAYMWRPSENEQGDIYVRAIDSNEPFQLTDTPAWEGHPVWSPDATRVAFVRVESAPGPFDIVIKPALGGQERVVYRTGMNSINGLDWSPDGRFLVFRDLDPEHPNTGGAIRLHDIETGEQTRISFPARDPEAEHYNYDISDRVPAISPDGTIVAFARWRSGVGHKLCLVWLADMSHKCRNVEFVEIIHDVAWSADSRSVLFVRNQRLESQDREIVQIPIDNLDSGNVLMTAFGAMGLATARYGEGIVVESRFEDHNIWRIRGPASAEPGVPEQVTTSTRHDLWPQLSRDGERLAFVSQRSGTVRVWVSGSDGSAPTELGGSDPFFPDWAPDGSNVIYGGTKPGQNASERQPAVMRISAKGGYPEVIRDDWAATPVYSRDGNYIIYHTMRDEPCQIGHKIMKMDRDGDNPEEVRNCGSRGMEGPDGRIYFFEDPKDTLSSVMPNGTDYRVDYEVPVYWGWSLSNRYLAVADREDLWLRLVDLQTGEIREWAKIYDRNTLPSFEPYATLSISANDEWIVYTLLDRAGSDLTILTPVY